MPGITRRSGSSKKQKTIQWLDATGMPIGLFPESQYEAETIQLGAEDILVFYTDGLSEAENPAGEQFSKERIAEIVRRCAAADGSQEIYDRLLGSVTEFRDGNHFDDDLTLIVLKL